MTLYNIAFETLEAWFANASVGTDPDKLEPSACGFVAETVFTPAPTPAEPEPSAQAVPQEDYVDLAAAENGGFVVSTGAPAIAPEHETFALIDGDPTTAWAARRELSNQHRV